MQLIKNTIKMLDDITMLDHNVQNFTPLCYRLEEQQQQQQQEGNERTSYAFVPTTRSYLQTTYKNVPDSTPTPAVSPFTTTTTTTTVTRITKRVATPSNDVDAKVTNNNKYNINNDGKNVVATIEEIFSNDNYIKTKTYKNNYTNNSDNNNNNNNIIRNTEENVDNNKKCGSCCQRCCEHKNYYVQHALQRTQQQDEDHQHKLQLKHKQNVDEIETVDEDEVEVQRHTNKQPKQATAMAAASDERVRHVLRTCGNNKKNTCVVCYGCCKSKQGKLFEKHHCTALLTVEEEQRQHDDDEYVNDDVKGKEEQEKRQFSTKSDEMKMLDKRIKGMKTLNTIKAVKNYANISSALESLSAGKVEKYVKEDEGKEEEEEEEEASLPRLIGIGRTRAITLYPPPPLTLTEKISTPPTIATSLSLTTAVDAAAASTITSAESLIKVRAIVEDEVECSMTKCLMSASTNNYSNNNNHNNNNNNNNILDKEGKYLMLAKIKNSVKNVKNQAKLRQQNFINVNNMYNVNVDMDLDVDVDVDSYKLNRRNSPQLVMPIEEDCSRLLTAVQQQINHHVSVDVEGGKQEEENEEGVEGEEIKQAMKIILHQVQFKTEHEKQEMQYATSVATAATTTTPKQQQQQHTTTNITSTTTTTTTTAAVRELEYIHNAVVSDRCFKETTASDTIKLSLPHGAPEHDIMTRTALIIPTTIIKIACKQHPLAVVPIFGKLLATMALNAITKTTKLLTSYCNAWLRTILLLLLLTTTAQCWNGRQDAMTNCTFPARWEGSWFLSGYQQSIHIKGSQFSYRGKCLASDGNKYLIVDEKGCHRCLVIYEKHKNVLQYKESECEGDSMYIHQANPPSALAMRSVLLNQNAGGEHRGGAHPNIPNSELNTKTNTHPNVANGHSHLSSSDQFILRSNDDDMMNNCPPDFCKGRETLQNLCDQIPGDALLYSLFRESAEPVKCPLRGPFVFTYNRGHGECKSPLSNIESCTEDSRLLLSFQACPDVQGTESTVEELTCLATWKDGNSRYLVGLVSHHHAISNEERYRCFVYEKLSTLLGAPVLVSTVSKDAEYKLAQSGDATCNGLDSAEVGSRIMSLRKPPLAERCDFPSWFKGPRHWHALMGNAVYNYHANDGSVHVIKPNGYMETRALCEQINKQTSTEMMAVVHYTTGCQSGFMCMMFYRRDTHVIEIQTGKPAARLEDACAPDHFDIMRMPFITLLASNPDPQVCPMDGLYNLHGAIGPPYLATRHKRNHSNKSHSNHGHHHQHEQMQQLQLEAGELSATGHENVAYIGHKRRINNLNYRDAVVSDYSPRNRRSLDNQRRELRIMPNVLPTYSDTNSNSKSNMNSNLDTNKNVNNYASLATRNRRNVPPCITNVKSQRRLWVGCTEPNIIDVRPMCTDEGDEEYSCHGSWLENGTTYIIARHKGTKHGVCISYKPTEGNAAKLVIGDACYRGLEPPPEHHLVANLSVYAKCGETGNGAGVARRRTCFASWISLVAVALCITYMQQYR